MPVTAGALGMLDPTALNLYGDAGSLTHLSYLSGLLLGIGLGFYALVPDIERRGAAFTLLTLIVAAGGLARLFTAVRLGAFGPEVAAPLVMELGVTPLLWLWQRRVARAG